MDQNRRSYSDKEFLHINQESINKISKIEEKKYIDNIKFYHNINDKNYNKNSEGVKSEKFSKLYCNYDKHPNIYNIFNLKLFNNKICKDDLLLLAVIFVLVNENYEEKIVILALVYIILDIKF